ncbi:MAG TPA: hypothetical protein VKM72_04525 [Thermoanaerobaculia bacterium]|nr:hypothetical protein [Thermoanaerobaculia bacterium]
MRRIFEGFWDLFSIFFTLGGTMDPDGLEGTGGDRGGTMDPDG